MTPNQLFAMPAIGTSFDIWEIVEQFPEIDQHISYETNNRISILSLANRCFDGERTWSLATVWFDAWPFMVVCSAGRGGRDYTERYITDKNTYNEAVDYIRSLSPESEPVDIVHPNDDIPEMTSFYGHELWEFYNPEGVNPKYKVGDIVIARVIRDHLRYRYNYNPPMVETRVRITSVSPFDPSNTYQGLQIDRHWSGDLPPTMAYTPGKGSIYAHFNDSDVIALGSEDQHHFKE